MPGNILRILQKEQHSTRPFRSSLSVLLTHVGFAITAAKGGKRGRKHKGTSHVAPAAPPIKVPEKPAPHKPVDYGKWDRLQDSDDDSDQDHAYMPADLGLGDMELGAELGGTDPDPGCACEHCRQRAEVAERAAAATAKKHSSSSKSVTASTTSQSGFDFGKAVSRQPVKANTAEGRASCTHDTNGIALPASAADSGGESFQGTLALQKQSESAKAGKKTGHSKPAKSTTAPEHSDLVLRPTFDMCYNFVQTHLPSQGFSDRVLCNVLEKLSLSRKRNPTEEPAAALTRTFVELRIDLDPQALVDFARKCAHSRKQQRKSRDADNVGQWPKQSAEAPASQHGHAHQLDIASLHASMAKQRVLTGDDTFSFTSLSGDSSNQHRMQPGPRQSVTHLGSVASGDSTPYESSSEDDDELPPCKPCPH